MKRELTASMPLSLVLMPQSVRRLTVSQLLTELNSSIVPSITGKICSAWKILSLMGSMQVWHTRFCMWAVVYAMSEKPPGIFPCICSYRTFSRHFKWWDLAHFKHLQNSEHYCTLCSNDRFSILHHASTMFQLKIKKPSISSGKNLHLIINFIMLI